MDWGPDNYAGVTFSNQPDRKTILMGWMTNLMYSGSLPTTPWRGQMTLPRIFDLKEIDGNIRLASTPVPGLTLLRRADQFYKMNQPRDILNGTVVELSAEIPFRNSLLEVDVEFDTTLAILDPAAYLQLCFFNTRGEEVCVGYSYGTNEIYLDRVRSGNTGFNPEFGRRATSNRETTNKTLKVKLYLDLSSIEIFADDGFTVMTGLFYPQEPVQGINVGFSSQISGNKVVLRSATVRGLNSIHGNC
jgi:fructan beta-fructosidase